MKRFDRLYRDPYDETKSYAQPLHKGRNQPEIRVITGLEDRLGEATLQMDQFGRATGGQAAAGLLPASDGLLEPDLRA